jgi:hypothetical protein
MRAEHAVRMRQMRNSYKIVGKHEENTSLGEPRPR